MKKLARHFYEFGPYHLDATEGLLLREGKHVPLTLKAYEILLVLVENSGHVIEKKELLQRIWPDTFVEEVNLAKNVSLLRKVLGGETNNHYIETIPKRGYRFVADVREVLEEPEDADRGLNAAPENFLIEGKGNRELHSQEGLDAAGAYGNKEVGTLSPPPRAGKHRLIRATVWLALGSTIIIAIWLIVTHTGSQIPGDPWKIVPLTSYPGRESQPAVSPDGNRIAFVWDGETGDNSDVYVRQLGVDQDLRLTVNPATDTRPAWSPDGGYIAFCRQTAKDSAFYLIPSWGGPERKIADVFPYLDLTQGNSQYYSPDGKSLAVRDKSSPDEPVAIFLLSIENGDKRKLTSPPPGIVGDSCPAFSPDGKTLAFLRSSSLASTDIYLLPLAGGPLRRVTNGNSAILGLAWTTDSREIVYSSRLESSLSDLWRVPVTGGTPRRLPDVGRPAISPSIPSQGNRLAYTHTLVDENIWRIPLDAPARERVPAPLISSTQSDSGPDYSPDGRRIVFASNRSGESGIWVCDANGANPMQLLNRGSHACGTPRWSPEGQWIAFESGSSEPDMEGNVDIYIVGSNGGTPRRLTTKAGENVAPSWSRDGKWIYFGSTRSGSMQIWKVPVEGGEARQVTRHGGFEGFESADGAMLYYAKGRDEPGIWQTPVAGDEETLLLEHDQAGYWRLWRVVESGIYFATAATASKPVIEFFDFASHKVNPIATIANRLDHSNPGISVSPDGRWLLITQLDQSGSDIMLVENFR